METGDPVIAWDLVDSKELGRELLLLQIARAGEHLSYAERLVAAQDVIVARLEADNADASQARRALASYEAKREIQRDQLQQLLAQLTEPQDYA